MALLLQLAANGIFLGCIYALLALSFAVIFSATRFWHFAHGAIFACDAYFGYVCTVKLGLSIVTATLTTVLFSALLGFGIELVVYRPLRHRGAGPMMLFIASMGTFVFLDNLTVLLFGSTPKSIGVGVVYTTYHFGLITVTSHQVASVLTSCVLFALAVLFLRRTKIGKALRAVASNPGMASVIGIDPDRVRLLAVGLGSALLAVPAILLAAHSGVRPGLASIGIFAAAISMIVGGIGSIFGAIPGGFLIGLAENLGVWKLATHWQSAIAFAILSGFLILRPAGFFGVKKTRTEV